MLQQRASQRQWKAGVGAPVGGPGLAAILAPLQHMWPVSWHGLLFVGTQLFVGAGWSVAGNKHRLRQRELK